jgi:hypothetical protein
MVRKGSKSKVGNDQFVFPGMAALEPNKANQAGVVEAREQREYEEQCALFTFLAPYRWRHPVLRWVHAVPNGLFLSPATKGKAVAQGMTSGIWDIFVPVPWIEEVDGRDAIVFCGLYVEMKYGRNKLTDAQKAFGEHLEANYYRRAIAYNWIVAAREIIDYLKIEDAEINQSLSSGG